MSIVGCGATRPPSSSSGPSRRNFCEGCRHEHKRSDHRGAARERDPRRPPLSDERRVLAPRRRRSHGWRDPRSRGRARAVREDPAQDERPPARLLVHAPRDPRGRVRRRRARRMDTGAQLGARQVPLVQPRARSQASLLARATSDRGAAAVTELWHFSEDPGLSRFEPRDGKIWAIDEAHRWLYWFPRDCPRATYWAVETTTEEDVEQWLDGDRKRRV